MTFLLILLLATLAAGGCMRIRSGAVQRRDAARYGLGIAFIAAGVSHFVNNTPFQQHLPDWVPAATSIILVSGIVEIALGSALVAARRSAPVAGLAAAVFLIGVFPANVYVAVAGVDVDGLPGGVYPWLRLPLQGLFVAWAWISTRPRVEQCDTDPVRPFGLLPALPPRQGPDRNRVGTATTVQASVLRLPLQGLFVVWAWISTRPRVEQCDSDPVRPFGLLPALPPRQGPDRNRVGTATTVQASVLHLRRFRDVPSFMAAALRLQVAFTDSHGAIEMSLRAAPLRRTFWTLSHWRSDGDLRGFVVHPDHLDLMRRFQPAMKDSEFITWNSTDDVAPTWIDAARRITEPSFDSARSTR